MPKKTIPRNEWPSPRRVNGHWCYWFFEQVYRENIHLIWPVAEKQRREYITSKFAANNFDTDADGRIGGRTSEVFYTTADGGERSAQVISLGRWVNDSNDHALLAHEALHAVGNILSDRGVLYDNSKDAANEPFAYLLQSIYLRCHTALQMVK